MRKYKESRYESKSCKWNYKLHFALTLLFMLLVLALCYIAYKNPQMAAFQKESINPQTVNLSIWQEIFRRMLQTKKD